MENIKRLSLRTAVLLLLSLLLSGIWLPAVSWAESAEQVAEVRRLLEQYHLSKPVDENLAEDSIDGMVKSLNDPYTEYFSEEEWETFSRNLEQNFTGIGIVMTEESGIVYVEDVLAGSPADVAGVLPGDAIVSVDGNSAKGWIFSDLQAKLRGTEGSSVTLGVTRDGKALTFYMVRKALQVPVAAGQLMGDGVGYVSLTGFTSDAGTVFRKQLEKLEKAGIQSLIIDLRDNGGGFVNAAQQIAGLFIADGVLAHLKDRDGKDSPISASGGGRTYPVTILVNHNSASASELFAGALQDYGIAKLVGTRTYGKGVVQSIMPLKSGGVLKLTVQEYFTPFGRKVDKTGLTPEHLIEGAAEQLIGAFRDAGGSSLTVLAGKGTVVVNGVRVPRADASFLRNSQWFVNLRLAASVAGAEVGYDKPTRTITLTAGAKTIRLPAGDARLVNKNGWSLIDLNAMKQWFPGLTSEVVSGQLQLKTK